MAGTSSTTACRCRDKDQCKIENGKWKIRSSSYFFSTFHFQFSIMLLAIDIGNSSIKFGVFDGPVLFHKFSIQTKRDYTAEELIFDRLRLVDDQFIQVDIDTCIVASVVPDLNGVIAQVCRELFKVTPSFVDHSSDFGFAIRYEP